MNPISPTLEWATEFADAYIFDMDGTIYLGDELLPGAKRTIEELRRREIPVKFLSNNPTKDPDQYVTKLEKLGLPTEISDISNTIVTTRAWLKKNHPHAKLFVIGEEPLVKALREAGFELTSDPQEIDIVVASYDRTFTYEKLQIAFDALWFYRRAILIQTNPDRYCPFPGGRGEPDCAAIVAAIEACTGIKSSVNLGKPSPLMLESSISDLDVQIVNCVMVGDRLNTDIRMAVETGMLSACVLTGEATREDVANCPPDQRPTYVLDRIDKLIPQSVWEDNGWLESDK